MRSSQTILVVDDHPPALYAASRLLRSAGFQTLEAATGEEAVHLSARASALLVDVNLPDLNGVAVCEAVKRLEPGKPVVLMSAVYVDALHRDAALQSGADLYLVPPLEPQEVVDAFDRLLA